jgi:hypothetical protein
VQHPIRPLAFLQGGIELFASRWHFILPFLFVYSVVSLVTLGVLAGPLSVGLYRILDRLQDDEEYRPSLRDLFNGLDRFADGALFFLVWNLGAAVLVQFLFAIPVLGILAALTIILFVLPVAQFGFPLIGSGYDWKESSKMLLAGVGNQPVLLPLTGWLFALLPLTGALLVLRIPLAGTILSFVLSGITISSVSFASRYLSPWLAGGESE